jgi:DNA modification methylase
MAERGGKKASGRKPGKRAKSAAEPARRATRKPARRCNDLDGKRWLQNSISLWGDIRKSTEELRLKHPAMFPSMLAERLIESFLPKGKHVVLDPFTGSGSTLVAAEKQGKRGIGLELSPDYVALTLRRLSQSLIQRTSAGSVDDLVERLTGGDSDQGSSTLYQASARDLLRYVEPESIDLCITSPPYWNILNQRRTADLKTVRHYGNLDDDLGTIADYDEFLAALAGVFAGVLTALKPGAHCCIVVMDLRKKDRFYPFHSDLATRLQQVGFEFDDLVIWNRQSEYNGLRPLGYPAVFRINKVHEFILLMRKPDC